MMRLASVLFSALNNVVGGEAGNLPQERQETPANVFHGLRDGPEPHSVPPDCSVHGPSPWLSGLLSGQFRDRPVQSRCPPGCTVDRVIAATGGPRGAPVAHALRAHVLCLWRARRRVTRSRRETGNVLRLGHTFVTGAR